MARKASDMQFLSGWKTDAKPVNWDLNAVGAKRASYVEPEGFVKEFVEAFDIGYKPQPTPKPQTQKI